MKKTDFGQIAGRYDQNKYRNMIGADSDLKDLLDVSGGKKLRVLDLACGTGLYLARQMEYFEGAEVEWHGVDASDEMLEKAKDRIGKVKGGPFLTQGLAKKLPYPDGWFDFVVTNYAFHHFEAKGDALKEVRRVLKAGGILKIHNISVQDMQKWWIYQCFPAACDEDAKRFWPKELIYQELAEMGFEVKLRMAYKMEGTKLEELVEYARNRDISVLTIIGDAEYWAGLERMEQRLREEPEVVMVGDFAEVDVVARKSYLFLGKVTSHK